MLQVDDGRGPTWPMPDGTPTNPGVNLASDPLRTAVRVIRSLGMQVIPVFNFTGFNYVDTPIRSDFWLPNQTVPERKYNAWSDAFVAWRIQYINACLTYMACDAVGIDFYRTAKAADGGQIPQMERMEWIAQQVRLGIPSYHTIMSVTQSDYYQPVNTQGVAPQVWFNKGYVEKMCIFCYTDPFRNYQYAHIDPRNLWVLVSSFNDTPSGPVSKTDAEIERIYRQVESLTPEAYGLFTANMLTAEHLQVINAQKKRITKL